MCPYSIGPDGTGSQSEGPEIFSPGQTGVEPILNRILARAPKHVFQFVCLILLVQSTNRSQSDGPKIFPPEQTGVELVSNRLIGQMYVIGAAHWVSNRLIGQMYVIGAPHSAQHQSQRWKNSFFFLY